MGGPQDERELVLQAQSGSEEAFTELIDRYHERIYRVAARIVRNPDEAEEVTQEVFVRAVAAIGRFDFRASFYTWLVSIARNAAFDALRSLRRRGRFVQLEDGFDGCAAEGYGDPVKSVTDNEATERVVEALGKLSVRDRTLLVLREYEDLQYEEIARVLGCSVGTVESGIHRARKRLRALCGEPAARPG
ncbi:MAG: sigma-70 family RNA polymerase sigma factor, partial [Planctomycetes bacterium]|nr:sigma-70 family RNA polymerase sigma factor [Planctomycetota bacterium]